MKIPNENLGEPIPHFHRRTIRIRCVESPQSLIYTRDSHLSTSVLSLRSCPCHLNVITQTMLSLTWVLHVAFFQSTSYHLYFRNSLVLQKPWFLVCIQVFLSVYVSLVSSGENRDSEHLNLLSGRLCLKYSINVLRKIFLK